MKRKKNYKNTTRKKMDAVLPPKIFLNKFHLKKIAGFFFILKKIRKNWKNFLFYLKKKSEKKTKQTR